MLDRFGAATRAWFDAAFAAPTAAQAGAWQAISAGRHALVVAPTGSGKTLAAFLWALDRLAAEPPPAEPRAALPGALRQPAQGARRRRRAQPARPADRHPAGGRTGSACRRPTSRSACAPATPRPTSAGPFARTPPDILITTPESLFLLLTSAARESLRGVETVIVDEVHAVARDQARRPPGAVAGAARRAAAPAGAADRPVRDGPADRRGGPVPRRRRAGRDRAAADRQDHRGQRARCRSRT